LRDYGKKLTKKVNKVVKEYRDVPLELIAEDKINYVQLRALIRNLLS
jgi:hypothetical protein